MNHFEVISSKSSYYYVTICRVCMSLFLPKRMHYMPTLYAFDPLTPFIYFLPSNPALCQSAAWSRSCRRKSVPTTQEWRGFTSTKGYECVQPPPISAQPHPNTAITQLQARSSRLCQLSSFSVPKLSFSLLTSTDPDGYLRTPPRCQPLCNELFTFVSDCRFY